MGTFGPDSTNPRLRRAFAHTQLHNFRHGKVSLEEARRAVDAASHTRKGRDSNFKAALLNSVVRREDLVLFIDWTGGLLHRPAFGGYIMAHEEAVIWEQRHNAAVAAGEDEWEPYAAYNAIFSVGFPSATLTTSADQRANFTWGRAYPLSTNPAKARLRKLHMK